LKPIVNLQKADPLRCNRRGRRVLLGNGGQFNDGLGRLVLPGQFHFAAVAFLL
jgi:hypothetical protein